MSKRVWAVTLAFLGSVSLVVGRTAFDLLCEFRRSMSHRAGLGVFQSVAEVFRSGGGSDGELALAFQWLLATHGFDCHVVHGDVSMSSVQFSEWIGDIGQGMELGGRVGTDGRWLVPMHWIRCRCSYGLEGRSGGWRGKRWVDLFPGLVRAEGVTGDYGRVLPGDLSDLSAGMERLSSSGGLSGSARWCQAAGQAVRSASSRWSEQAGAVCLSGGGGVYGYRSEHVQGSRPVGVVSGRRREILPEFELAYSLVSAGESLLSGVLPCRSLSRGILELRWGDGSLVPTGVVVLGDRVACRLCSGAEVMEEGLEEMVGRPVEIHFTFRRGGQVVGALRDRCLVGEHVAYVFSRGGHCSVGWSDESVLSQLRSLASEHRSRLDLFLGLYDGLLGGSDGGGVRVGVSRAGLRPFGESRFGELYRVFGHGIVLEGLGCGGGRRRQLSAALGGSLIGTELLQESLGGPVESFLGAWHDWLESGHDLALMASGGVCGGVGGSCHMVWDGQSWEYKGFWEDSRGRQLRIGASHAVWSGSLSCGLGVRDRERSWCSCLDLMGRLCDGVRGLPSHPELEAVIGVGVFCGVWRQVTGRAWITEFRAGYSDSVPSGERSAQVSFRGTGGDSWRLAILSESGIQVGSFSGHGKGSLVSWDGRDASGKPCVEGDYLCRLTFAGPGGSSVCERVMRWDAMAPRCSLHGMVKQDGEGRHLSVEYAVEDRFPVRSQLRIRSLEGKELYASDWFPDCSGSLRWQLPKGVGDVCQVELCSSDLMGNESREVRTVVLGRVFVGGSVWGPDSASGSQASSGGSLRVRLMTPADGAVCRGLVVDVTGEIGGEASDDLGYQLRLRDGRGRLLACSEVSSGESWCLSYGVSDMAEEELELRHPMRRTSGADGKLGRLDVTGLLNGRYRLELVVVHGMESAVDSCDLVLEKQCSPGMLEFSEMEGKVSVQGLELPLQRRYRSLDGAGDYGHGWSMSLGHCRGTLLDEREACEDLDGEMISVRTGGSRDVTLDLPDGSRRTFRFVLEPTGGWSYGFRGRFRSPGGEWELRPTVSGDVTALPGLEPYWDATGPGVPLDMFDFPGFVLSGGDGCDYVFSRDFLGAYEAVCEDGQGVMLDCWGDMRLSRVIQPDGSAMVLEHGRVVHRERDGTEVLLLELVRDGVERVSSIVFRDGSGTVLRYAYDDMGNLVESWKGADGGEPRLRRSYRYGDSRFPHLLTEVRNGAGRVMGSFSYDGRGQLAGMGNGMGGSENRTCDVFEGSEIRTDENGFESVYLFDAEGRVLERVNPDGGVLSYAYDSSGRMLQRTDELGRKTRWTYDASGRMTSRINAQGGAISYAYDASGRWRSMAGILGHAVQCERSADGSRTEYLFPRGGGLSMARDGKGRVTSIRLSGSASADLSLSYGPGAGVTIRDGLGGELEVVEEDALGVIRQVRRWVDGTTGAIEEQVSEMLRDGDGRLLRLADDGGRWIEYVRDGDGRVVEVRRPDGEWKRLRYDVGGRLTEEVWSTGEVCRRVYTQGGLLLLDAGPEVFPPERVESGAALRFASGTLLEHDSCGRIVARCRRIGAQVGRRALGGGCFECFLEDRGTAGQEECSEYDLHGQVVRHVLAGGREERLGYDLCGRLSWVEDGLGNRMSFERDLGGRVTGRRDPLGNLTRWTYDGWGHMLTRHDADGREWVATRDGQGRLLSLERTGEAKVTISRDGDGHVTGVVSEDLRYVLEVNGRGQAIRLEDALGQAVAYGYDGRGRLVRETSVLGHETQWGYLGEEAVHSWMEDGAGRRQEVERDAAGQVLRTVWTGDGMTRTRRHPDVDRSIEFLGKEEVRRESWSRDALGRRIRMQVDGEEVLLYGYDSCDRVLHCRGKHTELECLYGSDGMLAGRRYVRCGGREASPALALSLGYDVCGRVVDEGFGGRWRRLVLDAMGRVCGVSCGSEAGEDYRASYEFDAGGRRIGMLERRGAGKGAGEWVHEWTYDALGRLTGERRALVGQSDPAYEWKGHYDPLGNLVEERCCLHGVTEVAHHRFDGDNRLLSSEFSGGGGVRSVEYAWDGSGRLLWERCSGAEGWSREYVWDCRGLLSGVVTREGSGVLQEVSFEYGCDGLLCGIERHGTGQSAGVRYELRQEALVSGGPPKVLEYSLSDRSGVVGASVIHGHLPWGVSIRGQDCGYVYNGHGGPVRIGSEWCFYDGWGQLREGIGRDGPGMFGEWQDTGSGLTYMRGRFYSARLRRFISPDPFPGSVEEPRSLHRYAYCLNDPLNRIDPTGMFSLPSMLCAMKFMALGLASYQRAMGVLSAVKDCLLLSKVSQAVTRLKPERESVTVFVHGMAHHDSDWSLPMETGLSGVGVRNQDYVEFLWSGFSTGFGLLRSPHRISHLIAESSLIDTLLTLLGKGYEHVNVISHSWGTVLSRDVLQDLFSEEFGIWVTMGSPLGMRRRPPNVERWINIYNPLDPVVHCAPLLVLQGYGWMAVPQVYSTRDVEQYSFLSRTSDVHSFYWTDPRILEIVGTALMSQ